MRRDPNSSLESELAWLQAWQMRYNTPKLIVMALVFVWVVAGAPGIGRVISDPRTPHGGVALEKSIYYPSCDAARAAGAAPIRSGQAGYRAELDGDGNGIACEPPRTRF